MNKQNKDEIEITAQDLKDSLLDKKFLMKVVIFITMMVLFFTAGYLFAKEKGMRDGHAFANELISERCNIQFTYDEYKTEIDYLRDNHRLSDNPRLQNISWRTS